MLVLSRADVLSLLEPSLCLEAVERAMVALHHGEAVQPDRTVVPLHQARDSALFMPGVLASPAVLGTKVVSIYPGNHAEGIASHHGAMLLFEAEHGRPVALLEGSAITAIRTAAVSALATRLLAREDSRTLALLGTGVQARSHVPALLGVRPFERIRVWSPSESSRRAFTAVVAPSYPGVAIEPVESVAAAVRGADVVTTVTSATEPIVSAAWIEPGCHINAVGASTTTTREIDTPTVMAASLFVDHRPAAEAEAGELMIPVAEGALTTDHVRADIGAVASGASPGRTTREEITLFKSVGLAVQDLAAAAAVVAAAKERGLGQVVEWD